jgi:O-antigen ligase
VAGFTLKEINRVVIVAGGLGVLTLSQGRTSAFAALFALAVLFACSERVQKLKYKMPIRLGVGLFMFSSLIVYIAVLDPTLAGRTPIWSNFLRLFVEDPLFGIGTSGLEGYIAAGLPSTEVILYSHGHNVLLDMAVRYGVFLVILTIAALAIAGALGWRSRFADSGKTFALIVFLFVASLAETIFSWQYFSVYIVILIYVVAIAVEQHSVKKEFVPSVK